MNTLIMLISMIISGLLSSMNIWAVTIDDMRLSMNDVYMISLMTSWMFFIMGILMSHMQYTLYGAIGIVISIYCIRIQAFITEKEFVKGMIVHHSMAVTMSERLQQKGIQNSELNQLVKTIVRTQTQEINQMKALEQKV